MAADNWSAEGGAGAGGSGTTVAPANSGPSGTSTGAFFSGTAGISGGNTFVYTTAQKMHGTYGALVDRASGTTPMYLQRSFTGGPGARGVVRMYVRFATLPTSNYGLIRIQNSLASNAISVFVDGTGKLIVQSAAGTTIFTATTALSVNTWYRVEVAVAPGSTTTTGAYNFAYYTGDGTTAIETASTTTGNFGTQPDVAYARVGRFDTSSGTGGYYLDDVATELKGAGLIGAEGAVAPTATKSVLGDDIYAVDLRGSTSGLGGGLTFSASYSAGQTLTVVEPQDGVFLFVKSPDGPSQYYGVVSETGGGSASTLIDIPQLTAGTGGGYAPRRWIGTPGTPSQSWD